VKTENAPAAMTMMRCWRRASRGVAVNGASKTGQGCRLAEVKPWRLFLHSRPPSTSLLSPMPPVSSHHALHRIIVMVGCTDRHACS
jgi:hypothetical protein